ncbi:MAG: hypothetical protein MUE98_10340 [Rhodobacteraceae bacterium]|jgi:hypothetical protein|nr:hypothetical protein [Paracoccaceae bacterium]
MARRTKKDPATPDQAPEHASEEAPAGDLRETIEPVGETPAGFPPSPAGEPAALSEPAHADRGASSEPATEHDQNRGSEADETPGTVDPRGTETPWSSAAGAPIETRPEADHAGGARSRPAAEEAPTSRPVPHVPPPAPASGGSGGFVAGLIGGALAVAAGVGALWLSNPDLLRGAAPAPDFTPIEARLDTQAAEGAALASELAELRAAVESAPAPAGGGEEALARVDALERDLSARIESLAAELASLSAGVEVLDGRIGQVEVRPPVMEGGAAEATAEAIAELRAALDAERASMDAAIAEARGRIDAATAEAEALREAATASQQATLARAAYSRLTAALDAGGPFGGALADLGEVAGVDLPPELVDAAETGVPTIDALRRSFPDAARAALNAAVRAGVDAEAGAMERIGAFLRAQTGARSITPREGADPDAVLSRAEAALADGRLEDTLSLIDTLPEPAQAEMAAWRAAAEQRRAALAAASALSAALPAN